MYINNNSYFQLVTFIISFITHQKIILCGRGLDYVVPNLTSSRRLKHFCHKAELSPFSPFSSNCFIQIHPNLCTFAFIFTFHFNLFHHFPPNCFLHTHPNLCTFIFTCHFHLFHHFPQIAFFRSIPTCALSLFTFTFFTSPQITFFRSIPTCALSLFSPALKLLSSDPSQLVHPPTFILCMKCIQET